jgi:hypothetical protein
MLIMVASDDDDDASCDIVLEEIRMLDRSSSSKYQRHIVPRDGLIVALAFKPFGSFHFAGSKVRSCGICGGRQ